MQRQRAAIYVRVSSDKESQRLSPGNQLSACMEYASEHGMVKNPEWIYRDDGLTGTEMSKRNAIQRMLNDAKNNVFDVVIFTAISRFSRDLADAFNMKKRLEQVYGIRIVSLEEGYDSALECRNSEMVFTIHAMLAAQKSQEMSKSITRGLQQSARRGRHIGNKPPYGYTKNKDKQLIIDPSTSETVRKIYSMYISGYGSKAISDHLNETNIPTATTLSTGKPSLWQASTINAIIRNPVYKGTLVAHKWTKETDVGASRQQDKTVRKLVSRDEGDLAVLDEAHEAIIDKETWNHAQHLKNKRSTNKGIKRTANLLAGLLKCESCGGAMIVTGSGKRGSVPEQYKYVMCAATKRIGKNACENHTKFRYSEILSTVTSFVTEMDLPVEVRDEVASTLMEAIVQTGGASVNRKQQLEHRLDENRRQQERNLHAYTKGLFSPEIIQASQRRLLVEADHLSREIDRIAQITTSNGKRCGLESAMDLSKGWSTYSSDTQRFIVRRLISSIVFSPDGKVNVYLTFDANFV